MRKQIPVIIMNICRIVDPDGRMLVEDKVSSYPGITWPGGHVEPDESFSDSIIREVYEETGLLIRHPVLKGVDQWHYKDGEMQFVLIYEAREYSGTLTSSEEGRVFWMTREEFLASHLARGMEEKLAICENDSLSEIYSLETEEGWTQRVI